MTTALTIRHATSADDTALLRLAGLDSARPLDGDALVAEQNGRLVAALSLADGRAIADPFVPSRALVSMLRVAAAPAVPVELHRFRARGRPALAA